MNQRRGSNNNQRSKGTPGRNTTTGPKPPTKDTIAVEGKICEALPNAMFQIELDNGHRVLGHIAGKMRQHFIKILPGDRIVVELSPYDLNRGRITYRYR